MLGQYQTSDLFLGIAWTRVSISFYMHRGSIRLASGLCGIALIHVSVRVRHVLEQYQANELLLWRPPDHVF